MQPVTCAQVHHADETARCKKRDRPSDRHNGAIAIATGCVYALVAVGYSLINRTTVVVLTGAATSWSAALRPSVAKLPYPLAIAAGVAVTTLIHSPAMKPTAPPLIPASFEADSRISAASRLSATGQRQISLVVVVCRSNSRPRSSARPSIPASTISKSYAATKPKVCSATLRINVSGS